MVAMGSSFAILPRTETAQWAACPVLITMISAGLSPRFLAFAVAGDRRDPGARAAKWFSVLLMVIAIAVIVKTNFWPNKVEEAEKERIRLTDRDGIT